MNFKQEYTYNNDIAKSEVNDFNWTFVQGSIFVLRLNFYAKNHRL